MTKISWKKVREKKILVPTFMVLLVLPLLISLGNWQIQRLAWKNQLIEQITSALKKPPFPLEQEEFISLSSMEYRPVILKGEFVPSQEKILWGLKKSSSRHAPLGQGVLSPFLVSSSSSEKRLVLVHRGWSPFSHPLTTPSGTVTLLGIIRLPPLSFPHSPKPDSRGYWSTIHLEEMMKEARARYPQVPVSPFYIQQIPSSSSNSFPYPLDPFPSFPNNHLEYALTWYSLAVALCFIYVLFVYGRLK